MRSGDGEKNKLRNSHFEIQKTRMIYIDSDTVTVYYIIMITVDGPWTIAELVEASETSVRTIRYYISQGLLPKPQGRGRTANYTREHLQRLLIIRRLITQRVPLQEIRIQMEALSAQELEGLLANTRIRQAEEETARALSPREYVSVLLARARQERQSPQEDSLANEPLLVNQPMHSMESASETLGPWKRYELAAGIELHISKSAERREREFIRRLFQARIKEE
jgi:DNA-binding transcriptional MerR regulator